MSDQLSGYQGECGLEAMSGSWMPRSGFSRYYAAAIHKSINRSSLHMSLRSRGHSFDVPR